MAEKVTAVTASAAALKSRIDAIAGGGEALAPGYYTPEVSRSNGVTPGRSSGEVGGNGSNGKRGKKHGLSSSEGQDDVVKQTLVWFAGLSALSPTDRRIVETTSGGLRRRLAAVMGEFYALRLRIREDYKNTVAQRQDAGESHTWQRL
jgi:hypothetical protein